MVQFKISRCSVNWHAIYGVPDNLFPHRFAAVGIENTGLRGFYKAFSTVTAQICLFATFMTITNDTFTTAMRALGNGRFFFPVTLGFYISQKLQRFFKAFFW